MTFTRGFWIGATAVLFVASLSAAPAPIPTEAGSMRYKFKEGDKLRYTITEKGTMSFDTGAGPKQFESEAVFDVTWQVNKVDKEGKVTIAQKVDSIRMEATSRAVGKLSYDSKAAQNANDPGSKLLGEALSIFPGKEMILVIDAVGNIESLKFSKELADAQAQLPPAAAAAAAGLSEDSLRRMLGQCLPILPRKTPPGGQPWESKLKAKFAGAVNFQLDNKTTDEGESSRGGKKLQKLSTKSTLTVTADPGTTGTIKMKEENAGNTAYFDKSNGRLVDSTYTQKIEVEVVENGMTVTIKGNVETTFKLAGKEK